MNTIKDLIDKYCPDGVEYKTLGEVCDILTGYPFDSSQFARTGIRLLRGMNVKRGELDFSEGNTRYWSCHES